MGGYLYTGRGVLFLAARMRYYDDVFYARGRRFLIAQDEFDSKFEKKKFVHVND